LDGWGKTVQQAVVLTTQFNSEAHHNTDTTTRELRILTHRFLTSASSLPSSCF